MEVRVEGGLGEASSEALVVFVYEGGQVAGQALGAADEATGGLLSQVLAMGDFRAKAGAVQVIYVPGAKVTRLALAGLGKAGELTGEKLRNAAGKAAIALRDAGVKTVALPLPAGASLALKAGQAAMDDEAVAQAVAEGALLSQYQYHAYRTQDLDDVKTLDAVAFLAEGDRAAAERGVNAARVLERAIGETRRLILIPGADLPPMKLAEEAQRLGTAAGLKVTVLEQAELERRGFGALLGIGQGSEKPPALIVMEWKGADEAPIALVGKGITFDTGGIGIKPGPGMEKMKYDMGGGGAVVGAMLAIAELGLKRHVVGIIAAAENMPSGTAIKPGDIVTSYDGQTIEVNDTDAEGRVVLADALTYAVKDVKAQAIVDMATLTGAVGVALGLELMGVMGNHQPMVERVLAAGERSGDRGWQLPLIEEYDDLLHSEIADLKNYGGRYAGTSAAGAFLERFVGETPWVHLDIAAVGWTNSDKGYRPKGPTGAPVRMCVELVRRWENL